MRLRELGESATAIAKRLGLFQPAVSVSVARHEKIVEEMGLELFEG